MSENLGVDVPFISVSILILYPKFKKTRHKKILKTKKENVNEGKYINPYIQASWHRTNRHCILRILLHSLVLIPSAIWSGTSSYCDLLRENHRKYVLPTNLVTLYKAQWPGILLSCFGCLIHSICFIVDTNISWDWIHILYIFSRSLFPGALFDRIATWQTSKRNSRSCGTPNEVC